MNIETVLEEIACQEGISEPSMKIPLKSETGQGFLADITVSSITGKSRSSEDIIINFIIKSAATNDSLRESSVVPSVFAREAFMYKSVFPAYSTFEQEKGILNPFCTAPKCYYVSTANKPEFLILENLTEKGYHIWNRWLQMEDTHIGMVLRQYGKFHAVSFAIQDQKPDLFRKLTENFDNIYEIFLEKSGFFHTCVNKTKKAQTSLDPNTDGAVMERYTSFLQGIEETFKQVLRCNDKHFVILHGDCWSNNMMFKYEDCNKINHPTSVRFIDFQLAVLGSPARDIALFFYSCSSKEILENLKVYQEVYYESLSKHLRKLGTNPDQVYPFSVFEEDFRKYAKFGLIINSLLRYIMLSEENKVVNFTDVVESGHSISTAFDYAIANINKYNEKMRDVIVHCVENNFI